MVCAPGSPPPPRRLWSWDQIDLFVYFSHHMVTIPPPGWVMAAHRNGVRVLGTFITEWAEGAARCRRLFASRESAQARSAHACRSCAAHGSWLMAHQGHAHHARTRPVPLRMPCMHAQQPAQRAVMVGWVRRSRGGSLAWHARERGAFPSNLLQSGRLPARCSAVASAAYHATVRRSSHRHRHMAHEGGRW